jgi:excisionase family DNA binding protein
MITQMVTLTDIAKALCVTEETVLDWVKLGKFPQPRRFGRRVYRWPTDEVNAWVERHKAENSEQLV